MVPEDHQLCFGAAFLLIGNTRSYPTDGPLCSIFQRTKEIAEN